MLGFPIFGFALIASYLAFYFLARRLFRAENNLGNSLAYQGRLDQALREKAKSLIIRPK